MSRDPLTVVFWVDLTIALGGSLGMMDRMHAHDVFGAAVMGMFGGVFLVAAASAYARMKPPSRNLR